jgi:hypothetical protein
MYWDVTMVKPLADYRIYVEVADGRKGASTSSPMSTSACFAS